MMGAQSNILQCGKRLHLYHGPIDLVISSQNMRRQAFWNAEQRFKTILEELVDELPLLKQPLTKGSAKPNGSIAKVMYDACLPHGVNQFVTPMASVAGAVADTILAAMREVGRLEKAYVNNGGDIALYLEPSETFITSIFSHDGIELGRIQIAGRDGIGGIATSGRFGRSFSLGIADSVTVLARTAAKADVAATMIANAVDLPDHLAITRQPANTIKSDSDLGDRLVVIDCETLSHEDKLKALENGRSKAQELYQQGLILSAALFLQGASLVVGSQNISIEEKTLSYA